MKKLIIILGVIGVSLSAILVRYSNAPSLVLVLYRVLFAACILAPVVLFRFYDEIKNIERKYLGLCIISGIFLGLHFTAYFESLKYTSIAAAVVLVDTEVFFVALAMVCVFKEKISKLGWMAIGITFFGSVMIAFGDIQGSGKALFGDGVALVGAMCMAMYTLIGRTCRKKLSTTVYTFIVYGASAITVFVLLLVNQTPVLGYDSINFLTAFLMTICCTLLGHSIFSWGLKYEKASFIATVKLLEPVFAAILGFIMFQEIPTVQVLIGGIVVILGIYVYARNEKER